MSSLIKKFFSSSMSLKKGVCLHRKTFAQLAERLHQLFTGLRRCFINRNLDDAQGTLLSFKRRGFASFDDAFYRCQVFLMPDAISPAPFSE